MTDPLREGLFEETADGPRLIGGRCRSCDEHQFPLGDACPFCGAATIDRVLLSTIGTLWGATAVTNAPPGYEGPVPYGFGVVELPEGLRVMTRLVDRDPASLELGTSMTLLIEELPADGEPRGMFAFTPRTAT